MSQVDSTLNFEASMGKLLHPIPYFASIQEYPSEKKYGACRSGPSYVYKINQSSFVSAIFDGRVVTIFEVDSINTILTQYGNYFVAYTGVSPSNLRVGDYVVRDQYLGDIQISGDGDYFLEIAILRWNKLVDPGLWIKKTNKDDKKSK